MGKKVGDRTTDAAPPFDDLARFGELSGPDLFDRLKVEFQRSDDAFDGAVTAEKNSPLARIRALGARLSEEFLQRDAAIDALLAATMSGTPLVLLGPPGTGKSLLVRRAAELAGVLVRDDGGRRARYFEYLLTAYTTPEEVFGAPKIRDLIELHVLHRNTEGMLPQAEFAFLDEVFRGSGAILNALLAVLNERMFHDGATTIRVPLLNVVAAANEPPDPHGELAAVYDRFPLRCWVDSVFAAMRPGDTPEFAGRRLLEKAAALDLRAEDPAPVATINDFWALRARIVAASALRKGSPGIDGFLRAFPRYRAKAGASDRTLLSIIRTGIALGLLRGDLKVQHESHFHVVARLAAPTRAAHDAIAAPTAAGAGAAI